MLSALWADLDALRQEHIENAGPMALTDSRRKHLAARVEEHGEVKVRAMVKWIMTCTCGTCRACKWLRPNGYAHPSTYLRPEKCAEYVELAAEAMPVTKPSTPAAPNLDAEADAARLEIARFVDADAEIEHRDIARKLILRRLLNTTGGRATWRRRLLTPEAVAAFREAYPRVVASVAAERAGVAP